MQAHKCLQMQLTSTPNLCAEHAACCLVAQVGVISEAAGSAYVEMMKTKVICGMYATHMFS